MDMFSFLLGIYIGMELLGHVVQMIFKNCLHGYSNVSPQSSMKKGRDT